MIVIAVLINIPDFLRSTITHDACNIDDCNCYFVTPNPYLRNSVFSFTYSIFWHILGTFIPLIILTFCNIRLLMEIYKSAASDRGLTGSARSRDPTKITVILILIVTLFFVLVCPSMILSFIAECVLDSQTDIQYFQIAVVLSNVTQAVNFSINFILYCAVSPKFRKGLKSSLGMETSDSYTSNNTGIRLDGKHRKCSSNTTNYEIIDVTT